MLLIKWQKCLRKEVQVPEVSKGYSLTHGYRVYRKDNPNGITDKQLYRNICKDFNELLVEEALDGRAVRLPHHLGILWCKKYKTNWNKPPIDWNESKKLKKRVYHLNEHSDGWQCKWKWTKKTNSFKNLVYYSMAIVDKHTNTLSLRFKQEDAHKKFFTNHVL